MKVVTGNDLKIEEIGNVLCLDDEANAPAERDQDTEDKIEHLIRRNGYLRDKIQQLHEEIIDKSRLAKEEAARADKAEEYLGYAESQAVYLFRKYEETKEMLERLKNTDGAAKYESEARATIQRLRDELYRKDKRILELLEANGKYKADADSLERKLKRAEMEAYATHAEAQGWLDIMNSKIEDLQTKLAASGDVVTATVQVNTELREEKADLERANIALSTELGRKDAVIGELETLNEELSRDLSAIKHGRVIGDLRMRLSDAKQLAEERWMEIEALKSENQDLRILNASLRGSADMDDL